MFLGNAAASTAACEAATLEAAWRFSGAMTGGSDGAQSARHVDQADQAIETL